jgi:putative NADH-flavin reductase
MKIALFGATGGTGMQVWQQALSQGHQVCALVRNPAKLGEVLDGLRVVEGDVLDQSRVDACLEGAEAVLCSLGSHGGKAPVEASGTERIIAGMQRIGPKRLVVVTSLGVGNSKDQVPTFFRVLMMLTLKRIMAAKEVQEQMVRDSGLDWTIVRPGGLTDAPGTGNYRAGTDKGIKAGRISRADVAHALLQTLTDETLVGKAVAVSC